MNTKNTNDGSENSSKLMDNIENKLSNNDTFIKLILLIAGIIAFLIIIFVFTSKFQNLSPNSNTKNEAVLNQPTPKPKSNVIGVWYDDWESSTKTITKIGPYYQLERVWDDGERDYVMLTVIEVKGEIRYYEDLSNPGGDYFVITKDNYIAYYDDLGFVDKIAPKK